MTDKAARTYTHASNRAKPRGGGERKPAFKGVLDNPFRIPWPPVPVNLQNAALARLVSLLDGVSGYNHSKCTANRKRKRHAKKNAEEMSVLQEKRRKLGHHTIGISVDMQEASSISPVSLNLGSIAEDGPACLEAPNVLKHLVFGINEVTKRLESQVRFARRKIVSPIQDYDTDSSELCQPLSIVFVCRGDVDPPLLVDHLPHLVAAYNSSRLPHTTKLIPLPKGAESALAQAIGVKRVTVVGVDAAFVDLSALLSVLDSIPTLAAPWLSGLQQKQHLISTHIKQVRTSVAKDVKSAKEDRATGKSTAKQRTNVKKLA